MQPTCISILGPEGVLTVRAFFGTGSYNVKEQFYVYDLNGYIADVGGYLGLLLGHSILSLYHSGADKIRGAYGKLRRINYYCK